MPVWMLRASLPSSEYVYWRAVFEIEAEMREQQAEEVRSQAGRQTGAVAPILRQKPPAGALQDLRAALGGNS
jgi:hypothetical protein